MSDTAHKRLGETLRKLRLAGRRSQASVAQDLGVSRSTVTQIELGNRTLKVEDAGRFARAYGCGATVLLTAPEKGAERDDDELIAELIQALPELAEDASALDDVRGAVAVARELTILDKELGLEMYSPRPPAHGFGAATTPWESAHQGYVAAQEERSRMHLGDAPIRDVDGTLALMRVRATKTCLPEGTWSLFLQAPETGFLVVVNRRLSVTERRFQYAHAYAHTLFDHTHRWLVCRADDRCSLTEVRASAFADRFLLPEFGVQRYLHSLGKDTLGRSSGAVLKLFSGPAGSSTAEKRIRVEGRGRRGATPITACDLTQIACYFGVSRSQAAHNLCNLRYLNEEDLTALERRDAEGIAERAREALDLRVAEVEPARDAFRSRLLGLAVESLRRESIDAERFTALVSLVGLTDLERQALVDSIGR